MRITKIVGLVILALFIYSFGYANPMTDFRDQVTNQEKISGRPEITLFSSRVAIVIFSLDDCMREFKYDKVSDVFTVRDIPKYEDSTKSVYHKDPDERLKEAIKILK